MLIEGRNWRLTKHGRQRFLERVGVMTDSQIIMSAQSGVVFKVITGFKYKWCPDRARRRDKRLVTVLVGDAMACSDALDALVDRISEFTFQYPFKKEAHYE